MSLIQKGSGFSAALWENPPDGFMPLGVTKAFAIDPVLQIFGWEVTGDHASHVRRYKTIDFHGDPVETANCIDIVDDDDVRYHFNTELTDAQASGLAKWKAYWNIEKEPGWDVFPEDLMTLQIAAEMMQFLMVPPPWSNAARENAAKAHTEMQPTTKRRKPKT